MGRNVFISVLGTGYYHEVKYYHGDQPTNDEMPLRFIQEANIRKFCMNWTENDHAYFFVTKGGDGSREKNWKSVAQEDHQDGSYEGLSNRLSHLELKFGYDAIDIPDGFTESEVWDIFKIVFDKIKEGDQVIFDITHAFRSLPLLVMVLINYSKFLKNIEVKHIFYGAFEKLGPAYKVKNMPIENRFAPVLDLLSVSELQDWTAAANEFIHFGNVERLTCLTSSQINPILKETKGEDAGARQLNLLSKNLPVFIKNIQTCRGRQVIDNKEGYKINAALQNAQKDTIKPLTPILEQLSKSMTGFSKEGNINNGLQAVSWCLNHGLIQQGITLLKETINTLVCNELELDYTHEENRNIIDSVFTIIRKNIDENDWTGDAGQNKELTKKIIKESKMVPLLMKEFDLVSNMRNDINHAGFKQNSITKPDRFENILKEQLYNVLQKVI